MNSNEENCEICGKPVTFIFHKGIEKYCEIDVGHVMGNRVEHFEPHTCKTKDLEEFAKSELNGKEEQ